MDFCPFPTETFSGFKSVAFQTAVYLKTDIRPMPKGGPTSDVEPLNCAALLFVTPAPPFSSCLWRYATSQDAVLSPVATQRVTLNLTLNKMFFD